MAPGQDQTENTDKDQTSDYSYFRIIVEDPEYGEPEERLWISVLLQALADCLDPSLKQGMMSWILTEDFLTVIEYNKLDADKMTRFLSEILLAKRPKSLILAKQLKDDILYKSRRVV